MVIIFLSSLLIISLICSVIGIINHNKKDDTNINNLGEVKEKYLRYLDNNKKKKIIRIIDNKEKYDKVANEIERRTAISNEYLYDIDSTKIDMVNFTMENLSQEYFKIKEFYNSTQDVIKKNKTARLLKRISEEYQKLKNRKFLLDFN